MKLSRRAVVGWLVGLTVFLAFGFTVSLWDGPLSPRKVGTFAEWVAGVATVAAVSIALAEAAQARKRQLDHDRLELERAHRAQAERVAVWCVDDRAYTEYGDGGDPNEALYDPDRWRQEVTVAVLNGSDLPVYDAMVNWSRWPADGESWHGWRIGVMGPMAIGPGERIEKTFTRSPEGDPKRWPAVDMDFTDAAGVHWRRRSDGSLIELPRNQFDRLGGPWPTESHVAGYRAAKRRSQQRSRTPDVEASLDDTNQSAE